MTAGTVLELGPERVRIEAPAAAALGALLAGAVDAAPGDSVPCIHGLRPVSQLAHEALAEHMGEGVFPVHEAQSIALARPLAAGEEITVSVRVSIAGASLTVRAQGEAGGERVFDSDTRIRLLAAGTAAGFGGAPKAWKPGEGDLPPLSSRRLDAALVAAYARAAADPNPIHTDAAAARAAGLQTPVVHGMLVAGLAEPALRRLGLCGALSTIRTRFVSAVPVGASVTLHIRRLPANNFRVVACRPDGAIAAASDVAEFEPDRAKREGSSP